MSFRTWVTIITLILLFVVVFFGWDEISEAWALIGRVDLLILALLIPVQLFSYYATGGIIFSYLKSKGNLKKTTHWQMSRMALELNFVNHVLPSGGAAGFSYLGWVLHRHGVGPGRATMAQLIRFLLTFVTFVLLLGVAVIVLAIDHQMNRFVLMLCAGLAVLGIGGSISAIVIIHSKKRLMKFSNWVTRTGNKVVRFFTRGKRPNAIPKEVIPHFFTELHEDYEQIQKDKKILIVPFIWALLANIADALLLFVAFWALGAPINPAALFIAFGLSSIASVFSVTPGGAGVYETIMIAFLAAIGVPADIAIAGTLLARVTLLLGTIVFGYFFYQLTINKYGKYTVNSK